MSFLADPSVTLPWVFEDVATPWTEALPERVLKREQIFVPSHWPLALAKRADLPLATLDGDLSKAAKLEGVVLL